MSAVQNIPSCWMDVKLLDVCEKITQGPNPKYDKFGISSYRVLKTKDLYDDKIHYASADTVSDSVFKSHLKSELFSGDLLLAIVGQGSINKCNVFEGLPGARFIFTRALGLIRPKKDAVEPHFLKYFLQSDRGKSMVDAGIGGTSGQQVVTTTHLKGLQIPLPPLEEQRRIVAVLDEAFAAITTATANAKKNLANARETLLDATDRELAAGERNWAQTTVEAICSKFEYGTSAKSKPEGQVPVLRMGNLQNGEIDWSDLVFTDDSKDIGQLSLEPMDVLFNRTNSLEHVGKSAIVRESRPAIFAGYLIRLHYRPEVVDPEFLNLHLNSRAVREHGRALAGKSVNQANISAGKLKTYPINLPPLTDQRNIVSRISKLRDYLERLQTIQTTKIKMLTSLKQSLLHRAFTGELTAATPETIAA